jgi:hypothetical protein
MKSVIFVIILFSVTTCLSAQKSIDLNFIGGWLTNGAIYHEGFESNVYKEFNKGYKFNLESEIKRGFLGLGSGMELLLIPDFDKVSEGQYEENGKYHPVFGYNVFVKPYLNKHLYAKVKLGLGSPYLFNGSLEAGIKWRNLFFETSYLTYIGFFFLILKPLLL